MVSDRILNDRIKNYNRILVPSFFIQFAVGFKNPFPVARGEAGYKIKAYKIGEKLFHDFGLNFLRRLLLPRFLLPELLGSSNRVKVSRSDPASKPIFSITGLISKS